MPISTDDARCGWHRRPEEFGCPAIAAGSRAGTATSLPDVRKTGAAAKRRSGNDVRLGEEASTRPGAGRADFRVPPSAAARPPPNMRTPPDFASASSGSEEADVPPDVAQPPPSR